MHRALPFGCLALFSSGTFATEFCVSSAAELSSALLSAQADATEVTIRLVRGTYQGRFSFSGESPPQAPLSIIGGYNASCTARVGGQDETVIDGQNFGGALLGGALGLDGWRDFSVENLTIRNGTAGSGGGLGVQIVAAELLHADLGGSAEVRPGHCGCDDHRRSL